MRTAQELVGHKDMTMTLRYSHLSPPTKWPPYKPSLRTKMCLNMTPILTPHKAKGLGRTPTRLKSLGSGFETDPPDSRDWLEVI